MGKTFVGKVTKKQLYTAMRKENRENELKENGGWTATHKVHKSEKNYSRKNKHKERY